MTPDTRVGIRLAIVVFLAAVLQMVYADAMRIRGATPDFLLSTSLLGALYCDANGGAALGLLAGVLHASVAAPPLSGFGSLVASRTLASTAVGWLDQRLFRDNLFVAIAVVPVGTLAAEGLFFLFAPQAHVLHWLRTVISTALYNAVLAPPLFFILRRCVGSTRRRTL